ncbi:TIGR00703 family protein [Methanofervidicoccus sp. A16]|uniref:TIGR00703 family protein n=1 Tax=Methanofervidicoccus sp. A16 TaxID=2607662 RepID=UPI001188AB9C|nr:TIGR00703 family protein [Methanofervidicoccus sp. A16]AXI24660.1 TIGR00703 family protein [Methanofervidicoccus sp. A16]
MAVESKEVELENTLVFETLGNPEKEREFKLKSLKKWGFDLIFGKIDGRETYFTAELEEKKAGDKFSREGKEYEVIEVLEELPKNVELYAHIEMEMGRAYIVCELRDEDGVNTEVLRVPAASLLYAFFKKNKLGNLLKAVRNVGISIEFSQQNGVGGKPLSYQELPNTPRRFIRSVRKVEKETGFGRLSIAYYGETKDGEPRFWYSWLLPTIALFDLTIAKKVNQTLGILKVD